MEGCLMVILLLALDWGLTVFGVWAIWAIVGLFVELPLFTLGAATAIWAVIKFLKMIF